MGKKIIVAGGGHGGIGCAALLAKKGFDVTVYEKNKREQMGYDWTDIFDKKAFAAIGMELPDKKLWCLKNDMTFYGPNMTVALKQETPVDALEIQMERKVIYDCIIDYAASCGVKFEFDNGVEAPLMYGNRIVGIRTKKGEVYGDLVIDACGVNSAVRSQLPSYLGIQSQAQDFERFYVWRGFYEKKECDNIPDKFRLMLFHKGKLGISWVAEEEDYTDVLIGRFIEPDMDEVEKTLAILRQENGHLGEKLLRGGAFAQIPVRQPLAVLVADGYAAIGDSAFMTVPIIGSGIANSMKAAKILAGVIDGDKTESYSAATLWEYQKKYWAEIGSSMAPMAAVKLLLTRLEPQELDYIFEKGILNADDMTISADTTSLFDMVRDMLEPEPLKAKITGLAGNPAVLKKILRMVKDIAAATVATSTMPKRYEVNKVRRWAQKYNACFKR